MKAKLSLIMLLRLYCLAMLSPPTWPLGYYWSHHHDQCVLNRPGGCPPGTMARRPRSYPCPADPPA